MTGEELLDSNASSTSSFFYDPPTLGLKSTQQLNVDWSSFANHTFFSSAEVNVNVAFDQIINNFPFDGTRKEYEVFFEKLTGFEKYVYDRFPKNVGYLLFSGTEVGESGNNGTFISVNDYAGGLMPDLSKNKSGSPVLDPGLGSFTIEFQILPASQSNDIQTICQKLSDLTQGFNVMLLSSSSPQTCQLQFSIVSGSNYLTSSATLTKGIFNHVAVEYDRTNGLNNLVIYVNDNLVNRSLQSVNVSQFAFTSTPFLIGSGTTIQLGANSLEPKQTFSGALDEFRFYHSARTLSQIQKFSQKNVYTSPELKLYFKFNEPTGTLDGTQNKNSINSIALDSSGNSLHSYITNFDFSLRSTGSIKTPMTYEKENLSPVLFPAFTNVVNLNTNLLVSATEYDSLNPNLITRLIPEHYFLEGQVFDGISSIEGELNDGYTGNGQPGSGKLGTTQLLLSFLYVWAKFFDELKLFVDAFSSIKYVSYDPFKSAPDHFLPLVMKQYGFQIPSMFLDSTIEQYIDGEDIQPVISSEQYSLQYVQNQITRRVLANINEIIKSKGTQHSVRAFLRSLGVDPDNSFRIREFGGPTKQQLQHARETKLEVGTLLDFKDGGLITSPVLSGSRVEPGIPSFSGTLVTQNNSTILISDQLCDGLFTSGSWTFESIYKYPLDRCLSNLTQSLARINIGTSSPQFIFNLVALTSSYLNEPPSVRIYGRPSTTSPIILDLRLENLNIFDGNRWNISFGRERNDSIGSNVSSSYFLRAATQDYGIINKQFITSTFMSPDFDNDAGSILANVGNYTTFCETTLNLGNESIMCGSYFLNASDSPEESKIAFFNGQVARIRFWTKALNELEWLEHVKNYRSLGVLDPTTNFNFEQLKSGSWEKLRLDVATEQDERNADSSGNIQLIDYSQNNLNMNGSGFTASTQVINASLWPNSLISPNFDEASTNDKVRVRSFINSNDAEIIPYAAVAPVYSINPNEEPTDDTRFSIEFSLIDALNRDMINIFATLDSLNNVLGDPTLLFSPDYPTLEVMRNIYFNRLTDKINLKSFFEFYRWFDQSIGTFIEQLIPRKTKFFGTNFVVESHMLERPKMEYNFSDIYVSEQERHNQKQTILVQQIVGVAKKF